MRDWLPRHPRWAALLQGVLTALFVLVIDGLLGIRRHHSLLTVLLSIGVFSAVFLCIAVVRERSKMRDMDVGQ